MLELDKLTRAASHREREMDVPVLGETVMVRLFKKAEMDAMRLESTVAGEVENTAFERLLIMRGIASPALDDAAFLALKDGSAAIYYSLLNAVMEGNGLTQLAQSANRRTFPA